MVWHGSGTTLPYDAADDVRAGVCGLLTWWFWWSRLPESNRRRFLYGCI